MYTPHNYLFFLRGVNGVKKISVLGNIIPVKGCTANSILSRTRFRDLRADALELLANGFLQNFDGRRPLEDLALDDN